MIFNSLSLSLVVIILVLIVIESQNAVGPVRVKVNKVKGKPKS